MPPENAVKNNLEESSVLADEIEVLKRQLSSNETTIGVLSEENANLKIKLKFELNKHCCQEMSAKIDSLVQENEELLAALAKKQEEVQDQSQVEVNK